MIVLAIDPSTKASGIAIYNDKELKHYDCITATSTNIFKRIDKMITKLEEIIKEYKVEKVVIEDVYPEDVHSNLDVYKKLIYLQGFILNMLDKNNIASSNIKFYLPSEWRKMCGIHTGRGVHRESLKPKDIAFVKSQFGITVNDDIADAICIGFAATDGKIKEPQIIIDDSGFEFA